MMGHSKEEKQAHPTQKPVDLMRTSVINHTKPGELIYEPFGGSGTTLIAAETESRRCFGLEIEPRYCDVIVRRWQKFTGRTACLDTGETFDSVAASRVFQVA